MRAVAQLALVMVVVRCAVLVLEVVESLGSLAKLRRRHHYLQQR